jgi:hypothetical protein
MLRKTVLCVKVSKQDNTTTAKKKRGAAMKTPLFYRIQTMLAYNYIDV